MRTFSVRVEGQAATNGFTQRHEDYVLTILED
jgi:hypothetical protein